MLSLKKVNELAKGIFKPFLLADDDQVEAERTGGLVRLDKNKAHFFSRQRYSNHLINVKINNR